MKSADIAKNPNVQARQIGSSAVVIITNSEPGGYSITVTQLNQTFLLTILPLQVQERLAPGLSFGSIRNCQIRSTRFISQGKVNKAPLSGVKTPGAVAVSGDSASLLIGSVHREQSVSLTTEMWHIGLMSVFRGTWMLHKPTQQQTSIIRH